MKYEVVTILSNNVKKVSKYAISNIDIRIHSDNKISKSSINLSRASLMLLEDLLARVERDLELDSIINKILFFMSEYETKIANDNDENIINILLDSCILCKGV